MKAKKDSVQQQNLPLQKDKEKIVRSSWLVILFHSSSGNQERTLMFVVDVIVCQAESIRNISIWAIWTWLELRSQAAAHQSQENTVSKRVPSYNWMQPHFLSHSASGRAWWVILFEAEMSAKSNPYECFRTSSKFRLHNFNIFCKNAAWMLSAKRHCWILFEEADTEPVKLKPDKWQVKIKHHNTWKVKLAEQQLKCKTSNKKSALGLKQAIQWPARTSWTVKI